MASARSASARSAAILPLALLLVLLPLAAAVRIPNPFGGNRRGLAFLKSCGKSKVSGMTSSKQLAPGLTIHWKATTGSSVNVVVRAKKGSAPAAGWFSVGFSPGVMAGSNVLVAEAGTTVNPYDLSASDATAATWAFTSTSVTDGSTYRELKFTRTKGDAASVALKTGSNSIIWAYKSGAWSTTASHDNKAVTSVDFSCNGCTSIFGKKTNIFGKKIC
eukprot:TRINITY_DN5992_c0_g2_i2.p1 TRINITY_DN5992_c0_g2~~TRINITY_DN5992_c0_g2_i2.p1  ORF type:complete len:218 (+),score=2.18 TRINITY_DN5992_c0_g2_i2:192-845(+)